MSLLRRLAPQPDDDVVDITTGPRRRRRRPRPDLDDVVDVTSSSTSSSLNKNGRPCSLSRRPHFKTSCWFRPTTKYDDQYVGFDAFWECPEKKHLGMSQKGTFVLMFCFGSVPKSEDIWECPKKYGVVVLEDIWKCPKKWILDTTTTERFLGVSQL